MKIRSLIRNLIYAWLVLMPAHIHAQSVNVIDISQSGTGAIMKAQVDLQGKTVESVLTRAFRVADAYSTTCGNYQLFDGEYIVADLDYTPGDYIYRMEVTFTDGTSVETDCYNVSMTEVGVWLSDLPVTTCVGVEPTVDVCYNGTPLKIKDVTYYKGISTQPQKNNLSEYVEYVLPRTFDYLKFSFGMQPTKADGSQSNSNARLELYDNTGRTYWVSNLNRTVGYNSVRWPRGESETKELKSLKFLVKYNTLLADDNYVNIGAPCVFYKLPARPEKTPQTVTFENAGGIITEDVVRTPLTATSSGGTPVYYTIVEGKDIATIEDGNMLVPMPGKRGNIVVEALTFGDETYAPASAQLGFRFNFAPTVAYLAAYPSAQSPDKQSLYLYIDSKEKTLEELSLAVYDDVRNFNLVGSINVMPLLSTNTTAAEHVIEIPVPTGGQCVHQLRYKFAGEEAVVEPLGEGLKSFVYMSDLPYTISTGWGTATCDIGYGTSGRLANSKYSYSKGFGFHANGYVATTGDLSAFERFAVDVGGQKITNNTRGKLSFSLVNGSRTIAMSGNVGWEAVNEWNLPINGDAALRINGGDGGDGNTNDVIAIGAPRFYYPETQKEPQTLSWDTTTEAISFYKPFVKELTASASSGLDVIYHVVEGQEYARIEEGNKLNFFKIPVDGCVVVEALQPGDKLYGPTETLTCTFHLKKELVIGKDERVELEGGHDIEKLTIYADAVSAGQATVKQGVVNVKQLELKYTFVPGEWNYLAFPADLDLDAISNLNDKGYYLNNTQGGRGAYQIREYDTRQRAETPDATPWKALGTSKVAALKGYIMRLDSSLGTEPVEITFTIDNMSLDFESTMHPLHLTVDMTRSEPGSTQAVYIKPVNVKGNTLKVNVQFNPTDETDLPVNHTKALQAMRVTFTPNRKGIRLTLPDQSPARVAIFDKEGSHLVKAVNYVSPMMIDISGIEPGTYQVVVAYGPATTTRTIEL